MRSYIAELIGTFAIVFCGTAAIVVNQESHGSIGHLGIAITFGLTVMVMIYTYGAISGAQFNPAVSIGFALAGKLSPTKTIGYITSQCLGATLASLSLHLLFPTNQTLGITLPAGTAQQSFILETILSYLLMTVILHTAQQTPAFAGIAIGGTVLLEALFAGPICGASMNPARSLAPALIAGKTASLWIYLIAPSIGAIAATYTWKMMQPQATKAPPSSLTTNDQ